MSLVNRLAGLNNEPKIGVHSFYAALAEFAAGEFTRAEIVGHFELDEADDTELGVLIDAYTAAPNNRKQEFLEFIHRIFILAEVGAPGYTTGVALNARIGRF